MPIEPIITQIPKSLSGFATSSRAPQGQGPGLVQLWISWHVVGALDKLH